MQPHGQHGPTYGYLLPPNMPTRFSCLCISPARNLVLRPLPSQPFAAAHGHSHAAARSACPSVASTSPSTVPLPLSFCLYSSPAFSPGPLLPPSRPFTAAHGRSAAAAFSVEPAQRRALLCPPPPSSSPAEHLHPRPPLSVRPSASRSYKTWSRCARCLRARRRS